MNALGDVNTLPHLLPSLRIRIAEEIYTIIEVCVVLLSMTHYRILLSSCKVVSDLCYYMILLSNSIASLVRM